MPRKAAALAVVPEEPPQIDPTTFYQMLGAARYASHLSNQTKSDVIRFVKTVRDNKLFEQFGFSKLDDFLDSDFSPMPQRTFYRELEMFEKEGEQYDLFNEWKIPARIRRQLTSGDIAIDGDEVVIAGTERVSLTNSGSIKAILEQLVKEKLAAEDKTAATDAKLARAEQKIDIADQQIERLENDLARLKNGTPYEQQLRDTVHSMLTLTEKIGQLPDDQKAAKGVAALPHLERAIERIGEAYGLEIFGGAK